MSVFLHLSLVGKKVPASVGRRLRAHRGNAVDDIREIFEEINAAGFVFLPAAGFRFDSNVNNVGDSGYYWSSTEYADDRENAYRVYLNSRSIRPGSIVNRGYGFSVRLITECQ